MKVNQKLLMGAQDHLFGKVNQSLAEVNKMFPSLNITFNLKWEVDDNVNSENNIVRSRNLATKK